MLAAFVDPFDTLLNLQRELEARLSSDWLENVTTARGPFPPINVFQQGEDILAIIEFQASTRTICRSKPRKTQSGSQAKN